MLTACFNESQLIDSGDGKNFALQLTMPAPVSYADGNGGVLVAAGANLPNYEGGQTTPGLYWLIVDPHGNASVLAVAHRPVSQVGAYGFFVKQNGVIFVSPRSENDCAWAFVYKAR